MEGSAQEFDIVGGEAILVNESGLDDDEVVRGITSDPTLAKTLANWSIANRQERAGSVLNRDRFVTPEKIFDKFRMAADAVRTDDVVSGICETTEQLAFKRISIECDDNSEQNIWNQVLTEIDVLSRLREIWRELFTISQCYPAVIWSRKSYKVKGKTGKGNKSKKQFRNLIVPIGITMLDPCKVIPVGNFMFGQEKLIYLADREEARDFNETLADENSTDMVVKQLIQGPYKLSLSERQKIQEMTGVSSLEDRTFLLNPDNVWRVTSTRPDFRRFADVRMESVFELLDLKNQLRQMDRAALLGSTNAIILVKKGDKDQRATTAELGALTAQIRGLSRQPVIISDHRLEIDIITPDTDHTLAAERYNGIDSRITSRLYQILAAGGYTSGTSTDSSLKLFQVISASMEARRDMIQESVMRHVIRKMHEKNDQLTTEPFMAYSPRQIALAFDPNIATFFMDLRDRHEISRETVLNIVDIPQEEEAVKIEREAETFDKIFQPYEVPFSGAPGLPAKPGQAVPGRPGDPSGGPNGQNNTKAPGRTGGGNSGGGGNNKGSNKSTPKKSAAELRAMIAELAAAVDQYEEGEEIVVTSDDDGGVQ